jgi:hypothetical protein
MDSSSVVIPNPELGSGAADASILTYMGPVSDPVAGPLVISDPGHPQGHPG